MNQADTYLERLLKQYRMLQKAQCRELKKMPPGQLAKRHIGEKINYQHLLTDDRGKQIRRGITKNQEMIHILARKKYLQKSLELLEKNIPALESFLRVHNAPTMDHIIGMLPDTYQDLEPELFLPEVRNKPEEGYKCSTYRPEERTHITSGGLKVRSKSEVIIADLLDAHHIPYRYEEILYIENKAFAPDFSILLKNGRKYWEHCGRVHDPYYMKHHKWKLSMYEKAGIVPWKNLIVTYDDEYGGLDARIIESEIRNKLL